MWSTALICIVALAPTCCTWLYAAAATSGTKSTVGAQPAPVPASDVPELRIQVESEAQQRRVFPTDFAFAFDANDFQTPGGSGSGKVPGLVWPGHVERKQQICSTVCYASTHAYVCLVQFVQNNQVLATLPGDGVGQNLINVEACAINQPHVHPRGTEITHITKGKSNHKKKFDVHDIWSRSEAL